MSQRCTKRRFGNSNLATCHPKARPGARPSAQPSAMDLDDPGPVPPMLDGAPNSHNGEPGPIGRSNHVIPIDDDAALSLERQDAGSDLL